MGRIDLAMLRTRTEGGQLATQPTSNNGEAAWRSDSYYFSCDSARTVTDIEGEPNVALSFPGEPPLFVAVESEATV